MARLKVKADLVEGLRLTITNDFHWEYPEDAITLVFVEEGRPQLILSAARPLAIADMAIHKVKLERISYIEYDDSKLLIEDRDRFGDVISEQEQLDADDIIKEIQHTASYKLALVEHERRLAREQVEKESLDARKVMQRELSQLARLKAKYEGE